MKPQIVVALDGTPLAEQALPQAQLLAAAIDGGIHLVHVVPPASPSYDPRASRRQAERYLADVAGRLDQGAGPAAASVLRGPIAGRLVAFVRQLPEAWALAMVPHRSALQYRLAAGSVSEAVLRRLPVPGLLVPPWWTDGALDGPPRYARILVPLDGSCESERSLPYAALIARAHHARLALLRTIAPWERWPVAALVARILGRPASPAQSSAAAARDYLERLAERLEARGVPTDVRVAYGRAGSRILAVSDEDPVDLIMMASRHGAPWLRLADRRTSFQVRHQVLQPTFLVPSGSLSMIDCE